MLRRPRPAALAFLLLFALPACRLRAQTNVAPQTTVAPLTAAAPLTNDQAQQMVKQVLHTELLATQDTSHPMQYLLRKVSPRLTTTKRIVETKDGDVARLIAVGDKPLGEAGQHDEDARLQALLNNPEQERDRQEREMADTERARKILRALPDAFLYSYAGIVNTPQGPDYRMQFQPNPNFDPQDLEAQALKGMAGELWIDVAQQRVTLLDGKRLHDVDYGMGALAKLEAGGTLRMEQADIGNHQWRTTKLVLVMNAQVLFKVVQMDTTLEMSQFSPVPAGMSYQQAISMLRTSPGSTGSPSH